MLDYIEFEVSLRDIEPRIWRRFLLPADATFDDLNNAIQDAFGWAYEHLWKFRGTKRRDEAIAGHEACEGAPDANEVGLLEVFGRRGKPKCVYIYDFGDTWVHDVTGVLRRDVPEKFRRRLLGGERSGPPEDSGGPPGYDDWCEFVQTGTHPTWDAEDAAEWIGDWTPDGFDLEETRGKFDRPSRG